MAVDDKVAVVFIHGMGEQRRYADSAELASRLSAFARAHPELGAGHREPEVRLVARRSTSGTAASGGDERPRPRAALSSVLAGRRVEFHDAYWAPLVAGKTDFRSMYRWLRGRSWQPLWCLVRRWARYAQLKIDVLQEDRDHLTLDERELVGAYLDFVRDSGPHRPRGEDSFAAFERFLGARTAPADRGRILAAARRWRTRYVRSMLWALVRTGPIVAAIGAAALSVPLIAVWVFRRLVQPPSGPGEALLVGGVVVVWLTAFWLARFLTHYLGDVEVYATYNEASERYETREAVLRLATEALRRPLADDTVGRVVVVAHSLGSVIAWDAVRALALENEAKCGLSRDQLKKLSRVVTYGSPVDKIRFYHFADDGNNETFRRILDAMRVDTGHPALTGGVAWDNYYDPADLIGGRLESPNDRLMEHPVRNYAVANPGFANPFHGHAAYLENPDVLRGVLRAIKDDARPAPSPPSARIGRSVATSLEVLVVTAAMVAFGASQLAPLFTSGSGSDLFGALALALVIAMLAWLA
jgi:hypothetical protein